MRIPCASLCLPQGLPRIFVRAFCDITRAFASCEVEIPWLDYDILLSIVLLLCIVQEYEDINYNYHS